MARRTSNIIVAIARDVARAQRQAEADRQRQTKAHAYVKARDALEAKLRKPAEIKELYQDVVAAVCLRTIHEVLESDQGQHIALVTFNGCVRTVDPATG